MLGRYGRLLKYTPLLLVLYILYISRRQQLFERFLANSSIDFSDFEPTYATALKAVEKGVPEYKYSAIENPEPEKQTTIPPNIHFIWFPNLYHEHLDVSKIPAIGSDAPRLCREHNPTYNIWTWNETASRQLLEEHYAWFIPTYDAYRYPIQRVDAIKYFVLYHYGGVYMDLDIACRRPLDPLLPFPAWYPKATPFGVNNDLMATRARHPLTLLQLKQLAPRNKNLLFPYLTIFWSTGPQFTSDLLKMWYFALWGGQSHSYEAGTPKTPTDPDTVYVLPLPFYSEEYTFFGHSPGGTWHGDDVKVVLWLVDHPWWFAVIPVGVFAVFMGALRMRRRGGGVGLEGGKLN